MTPATLTLLSPRFIELVVSRAAGIAASPWRNRENAALYIGHEVAFIDRLRAEGRLIPDYCGVAPLFKVSDLDRIVAEETRHGKRRKGKQKMNEAA